MSAEDKAAAAAAAAAVSRTVGELCHRPYAPMPVPMPTIPTP